MRGKQSVRLILEKIRKKIIIKINKNKNKNW